MSNGDKKVLNWVLGTAATLATGGVLWLVQFFASGFDQYVEDIAATTYNNNGVPASTIAEINNRLASIEEHMKTQDVRDSEFREQSREDMRNLVTIISRRVQ